MELEQAKMNENIETSNKKKRINRMKDFIPPNEDNTKNKKTKTNN